MRTITNFHTRSIESEWKEWKAKICPPDLTPENERGLKIAFLSGATVGARMAIQIASVSGQSIVEHAAIALKTFAQSTAGGGGGSSPPPAGPQVVDPDLPAPGKN